MDYFYSTGADALHMTLEQWRNQKDGNGLIQTLDLWCYIKNAATKHPAEKLFLS